LLLLLKLLSVTELIAIHEEERSEEPMDLEKRPGTTLLDPEKGPGVNIQDTERSHVKEISFLDIVVIPEENYQQMTLIEEGSLRRNIHQRNLAGEKTLHRHERDWKP
jgi:hypothetical protein